MQCHLFHFLWSKSRQALVFCQIFRYSTDLDQTQHCVCCLLGLLVCGKQLCRQHVSAWNCVVDAAQLHTPSGKHTPQPAPALQLRPPPLPPDCSACSVVNTLLAALFKEWPNYEWHFLTPSQLTHSPVHCLLTAWPKWSDSLRDASVDLANWNQTLEHQLNWYETLDIENGNNDHRLITQTSSSRSKNHIIALSKPS